MRVLFFGTYDVTRHPRVQIMIDGFRDGGDTVEECNVPLGVDTDTRVRMVRRPWLLALLAWRIARSWAVLWRRSRAMRGPYDAVVVGYLSHADVHLARRLYPRTPVVLDYFVSLADTVADRDIGVPLVRRAFAAVDKAATRAADVVVLDTDEQRSTVLAPPRWNAVVAVPIGTPPWWFRAPGPLPPEPLRVLFFALYTPLQGAPVIARAIASLADDAGIAFTMIGGGQDHAEARRLAAANPHVDWRPPADPASLPDVASEHHVCLGIFGTGPKALRVVPNKIYQGAAAGCVLVTSDTKPQRAMLGDAACYAAPGDPGALADVLRGLARDPARVEALRHAAYDLADRCFRPAQVVAPLRERLSG